MKVAPLRNTDPWFQRLARHSKADVQTLHAVPCDIAVRMEVVSILHHGIEHNYRPYLHLRGQLASLQPDLELPYGITELPFRSGTELDIDAFYEFSPAQLTELVHKGYFSSHFQVPESMIGIVWELPAEADFLVVAPENIDHPPLVFVGVHDQNSSVFTEETSGYTLSEYFPTYSSESSPQSPEKNKYPVSMSSEATKDLFADEYFEDGAYRRSTELTREDQTPESVFDLLVKEVEAQRQDKKKTEKPGTDYDPNSPEGLLRERITPGVEHALSDRSEENLRGTLGRSIEPAQTPTTKAGPLHSEEAESTPEVGIYPASRAINEKKPNERRDTIGDYQPGA